MLQSSETPVAEDPVTRHFIHTGRSALVAWATAIAHPHIPVRYHPHIFPLYEPSAVDIVLFWAIPSQGRSGHLLVTGLSLGASHAPLRELLEESENAKAKRSMYAETQRERAEVLEAVRNSLWNADSNPLLVTVEDGLIVEHDFKKGYRSSGHLSSIGLLTVCLQTVFNPRSLYIA